MSGQHHEFQRSVRPNENEPKCYHSVISPESFQTNIRFSDLQKRDSAYYESVTDIFPSTSEPNPPHHQMNTTEDLCPRCHNHIGNKPFCYRCFGPQPTNSKMTKCNWFLIVICHSVLIVCCFAMCIMHMYNYGLYKEENIVVIQKEMQTVLGLLRYITRFNDGFISQTRHNMSFLFGNVTYIKQNVLEKNTNWSMTKQKISHVLDLICKQYTNLKSDSDLKKTCNLVINGTYFT